MYQQPAAASAAPTSSSTVQLNVNGGAEGGNAASTGGPSLRRGGGVAPRLQGSPTSAAPAQQQQQQRGSPFPSAPQTNPHALQHQHQHHHAMVHHHAAAALHHSYGGGPPPPRTGSNSAGSGVGGGGSPFPQRGGGGGGMNTYENNNNHQHQQQQQQHYDGSGASPLYPNNVNGTLQRPLMHHHYHHHHHHHTHHHHAAHHGHLSNNGYGSNAIHHGAQHQPPTSGASRSGSSSPQAEGYAGGGSHLSVGSTGGYPGNAGLPQPPMFPPSPHTPQQQSFSNSPPQQHGGSMSVGGSGPSSFQPSWSGGYEPHVHTGGGGGAAPRLHNTNNHHSAYHNNLPHFMQQQQQQQQQQQPNGGGPVPSGPPQQQPARSGATSFAPPPRTGSQVSYNAGMNQQPSWAGPQAPPSMMMGGSQHAAAYSAPSYASSAPAPTNNGAPPPPPPSNDMYAPSPAAYAPQYNNSGSFTPHPTHQTPHLQNIQGGMPEAYAHEYSGGAPTSHANATPPTNVNPINRTAGGGGQYNPQHPPPHMQSFYPANHNPHATGRMGGGTPTSPTASGAWLPPPSPHPGGVAPHMHHNQHQQRHHQFHHMHLQQQQQQQQQQASYASAPNPHGGRGTSGQRRSGPSTPQMSMTPPQGMGGLPPLMHSTAHSAGGGGFQSPPMVSVGGGAAHHHAFHQHHQQFVDPSLVTPHHHHHHHPWHIMPHQPDGGDGASATPMGMAHSGFYSGPHEGRVPKMSRTDNIVRGPTDSISRGAHQPSEPPQPRGANSLCPGEDNEDNNIADNVADDDDGSTAIDLYVFLRQRGLLERHGLSEIIPDDEDDGEPAKLSTSSSSSNRGNSPTSSNHKIAVDGNYALLRLRDKLRLVDPLWFLHSPLPKLLLDLVRTDVESLRDVGLEPIYVFNGLGASGDVEAFVTPSSTMQERSRVWELLDPTLAPQPGASSSTSGNASSSSSAPPPPPMTLRPEDCPRLNDVFDVSFSEDVEMAVARYLKSELGVAVVTAPYLNWAQMIAMHHEGLVQLLFAPPEALMFAYDDTELIMDIETRNPSAPVAVVRRRTVLEKLFPHYVTTVNNASPPQPVSGASDGISGGTAGEEDEGPLKDYSKAGDRFLDFCLLTSTHPAVQSLRATIQLSVGDLYEELSTSKPSFSSIKDLIEHHAPPPPPAPQMAPLTTSSSAGRGGPKASPPSGINDPQQQHPATATPPIAKSEWLKHAKGRCFVRHCVVMSSTSAQRPLMYLSQALAQSPPAAAMAKQGCRRSASRAQQQSAYLTIQSIPRPPANISGVFGNMVPVALFFLQYAGLLSVGTMTCITQTYVCDEGPVCDSLDFREAMHVLISLRTQVTYQLVREIAQLKTVRAEAPTTAGVAAPQPQQQQQDGGGGDNNEPPLSVLPALGCHTSAQTKLQQQHHHHLATTTAPAPNSGAGTTTSTYLDRLKSISWVRWYRPILQPVMKPVEIIKLDDWRLPADIGSSSHPHRVNNTHPHASSARPTSSYSSPLASRMPLKLVLGMNHLAIPAVERSSLPPFGAAHNSVGEGGGGGGGDRGGLYNNRADMYCAVILKSLDLLGYFTHAVQTVAGPPLPLPPTSSTVAAATSIGSIPSSSHPHPPAAAAAVVQSDLSPFSREVSYVVECDPAHEFQYVLLTELVRTQSLTFRPIMFVDESTEVNNNNNNEHGGGGPSASAAGGSSSPTSSYDAVEELMCRIACALPLQADNACPVFDDVGESQRRVGGGGDMSPLLLNDDVRGAFSSGAGDDESDAAADGVGDAMAHAEHGSNNSPTTTTTSSRGKRKGGGALLPLYDKNITAFLQLVRVTNRALRELVEVMTATLYLDGSSGCGIGDTASLAGELPFRHLPNPLAALIVRCILRNTASSAEVVWVGGTLSSSEERLAHLGTLFPMFNDIRAVVLEILTFLIHGLHLLGVFHAADQELVDAELRQKVPEAVARAAKVWRLFLSNTPLPPCHINLEDTEAPQQ